MTTETDPFGAKETVETPGGKVTIYRLDRLEELGLGKISKLPYSIKILLESLLRNVDGRRVTEDDVKALASWEPNNVNQVDIPFIPSRVILQDFTGVPAVVDLAALRSAIQRFGGDPSRINPVIPSDLIIDHSVQVDKFGDPSAREFNEQLEFSRNQERYAVLRWAQNSFDNFRIVPPGRGIVHQVNLEYLADVVHLKELNDELIAFPDSLVGTDSHTTMINGLGVLGWGVGGIEAEAVMLGQPYYMPIPEVFGVKLTGKLRDGVTATDLVLTVTELLRAHDVVGKFVEFYGPGLENLSLPDRATISNMAPEYGATMGFFPVDDKTLKYLELTGRDKSQINLIKLYCEKQGLFNSPSASEPDFSETIEFDISTVEPSLAGPKRPQDRIKLQDLPTSFHETMKNFSQNNNQKTKEPQANSDPEYNRWHEEGGYHYNKHITPHDETMHELSEKDKVELSHGSIVIAAITSCTNTSNPSVLIGAGLLAKSAVELGLKTKPYVKTSLAPGSRVVTEYLKSSGLLQYLEELGFYLVGYGCTTCIGNSGPINDEIVVEVKAKDLTVAAVLSGNRNFEGRINPIVKANYLASPPLVVAYAIAGSVDINLKTEPLGHDEDGKPIYLKDIWPRREEIEQIIKSVLNPDLFKRQYSEVLKGTQLWNDLAVPSGKIYEWDPNSTYIREPPFFTNFPLKPPDDLDIKGGRVLALLGDSITTDHISPAGSFSSTSPAGQYLISNGVSEKDFNSFGSRRGNHEVMMRGTFGNIRLKNQMVSGKEGGFTVYHPTNEEMTIYDAAMEYQKNEIPLIVLAGKEYGTGSSRDWAAKGTFLLGVKAVIAESYERIHRSNLVGMGVLPLQFKPDENIKTLGLSGTDTFDILNLSRIAPGGEQTVIAKNETAEDKEFNVILKLNSEIEIEYYRNGGILHKYLRDRLNKN